MKINQLNIEYVIVIIYIMSFKDGRKNRKDVISSVRLVNISHKWCQIKKVGILNLLFFIYTWLNVTNINVKK